MTKGQLQAVIKGLAQLASKREDLTSLKAIRLTVFNDGSGGIGRCDSFTWSDTQAVHDFDTVDQLAQILRNAGVEVTECP